MIPSALLFHHVDGISRGVAFAVEPHLVQNLWLRLSESAGEAGNSFLETMKTKIARGEEKQNKCAAYLFDWD